MARREQDPDYGWLTVNTLDFKQDSKLSKSLRSLDSCRDAKNEANKSLQLGEGLDLDLVCI